MDYKSNMDSIENKVDYSDKALLNKGFLTNYDSLSIFKRSERICSAVLLVAGFIRDEEPIKLRIKDNVLGIVPLVFDFCVGKRDVEKQIFLESARLLSMLRIGAMSGIVSSMNVAILKLEISSFLKDLNDFAQRTNSLSDFDFSVEKEIDNIKSLSIKDNLNRLQSSLIISNGHITDNKGHNIIKDYKGNRTATISGLNRRNLDNDEARRLLIVDIVKASPQGLSSLDIYKAIPELKRKSVQRELHDLVSHGKLRKIGDKRWSKYFMV